MDKNSIIGLLLIGAILITFTFLNKPEQEVGSLNEDTISQNDSTISIKLKDTTSVAEVKKPSYEIKLDEAGYPVFDSITKQNILISPFTGNDTLLLMPSKNDELNYNQENIAQEIYTLENDRIKVEISNYGATIKNVYIKGYQSYQNYVDKTDQFLQLTNETSNFGITFPMGENIINTKNLNFSLVESKEDRLILESKLGKKSVIVSFTTAPNSYDVSYQINFKGFESQSASNVNLVADFKMLSTEKHKNSEKMSSSIYYDDGGSYNYLSTGSEDDLTFDEATNWIAFKQSFFSAIVMKEDGFGKGSKIFSKDIEDDSYVKEYKAELNLGMKTMSEQVEMKWYFGPNDYDILKLHNNGCEDIVDLGWGLFRWINVYALRPIFNAFMNWGLGAGFAIFLLTLIVKLILSPVNYKMYMSSAMMKVLRPEITAIQAKYPKKEDGMKKQQELMALYKESGASPMAGCVPMLIQMPILFAIFRLFPSSIEIRQKSFLWAEDLSTYDSIYNLGFDIWMYGDHISLFTLLMAGTTLAYTHFNSGNMQQPTQEGMPNMKFIMYLFPIMMIFFFNSYSSGLSYYYFISTLMTMLIMFAIKKFIIDEEKVLAKIQKNKANPNKKNGKSGFAKRLEEAQRLQQEKMKSKGKK